MSATLEMDEMLDSALSNYEQYIRGWSINSKEAYSIDDIWSVFSDILFDNMYNLIIIKGTWTTFISAKSEADSIEKKIMNPNRDAKSLIFVHINQTENYTDHFCPLIYQRDNNIYTPLYDANHPFILLVNEIEVPVNRPLYLNEILEITNCDKQYVNYNYQVVFVSIKHKEKKYLLPCLPSGINKTIPYDLFTNISGDNYQTRKKTVTFLSDFTEKIQASKRYSKINYNNDESNLNKNGIITLNNQFIKCSDLLSTSITSENEGEFFYREDDDKLADVYIQETNVIETNDKRKIFIEDFELELKTQTHFKCFVRRWLPFGTKIKILEILDNDSPKKVKQIGKELQNYFKDFIDLLNDPDDPKKFITLEKNRIMFTNIENVNDNYTIVSSNLVKNTTYRQYMLNPHLYLDVPK
jgi:hypothetical protein